MKFVIGDRIVVYKNDEGLLVPESGCWTSSIRGWIVNIEQRVWGLPFGLCFFSFPVWPHNVVVSAGPGRGSISHDKLFWNPLSYMSCRTDCISRAIMDAWGVQRKINTFLIEATETHNLLGLEVYLVELQLALMSIKI